MYLQGVLPHLVVTISRAGALLKKIVVVVKKSGLLILSMEVNGVEVKLKVDAKPQAFSTLEKQAKDWLKNHVHHQCCG